MVSPVAAGTAFVAVSELSVPPEGRAALEDAFAHRLGAVEAWPGFQGLEVWSDSADPTKYVMVSWWDSHSDFRAYMASEDHACSHARIPSGPDRARPRSFRRYQVVAR